MAKRGSTKAPSDQPSFGGRSKRQEYVPGEYFVRVHPDALRPHVPASARARGGGRGRTMAFTAATAAALPEGVTQPLDYLRDNVGLKKIRPLFAESAPAGLARASVSGRQRDRLAMAASVVIEDDDDLAGIAVAELDPKARSAALRHAESANAIDFIEPVPARWLAAGKPDPMANLQWGLRAIRWFDTPLPGASAVTVGILDTGIDERHPDLVGVPVDYTHAGRAEDIVGHGTHVAGIIAAETNNAVGIAGVASCRIHMWKVFPDEPWDDGEYYVDTDLFHDALRSAADSGLTVLNMSLGGTAKSRTEQLLVRRLLDRGVLVVAAMGNEFHRGNPIEYPGAYAGVLAVGAIAENRERSDFSNTGSHIGICAPGSKILSTLPRRRSSYRSEKMYASWSGTSMATPHVAAAAALVAAKDPAKGPADIDAHLRKTAATLAAMKGKKRTNEYGEGLLDLARALS
jgi:subtilisin family serine protease